MAVKTFTTGEVLTAADTNTYLNNGGLVYIKSQTIGSGVSTVTVSDAFSATYDNYRIIVNGGAASTDINFGLRLGSTTTGYYEVGLYTQISSTAVAAYTNSNAAVWSSVGYGSADGLQSTIELRDPFNADQTVIDALATQIRTTGYVNRRNGYLANTASYTAFTLIPNAGTLTGGTITVYGYRKA